MCPNHLLRTRTRCSNPASAVLSQRRVCVFNIPTALHWRLAARNREGSQARLVEMRRSTALLLGLSVAAALHPQVRLSIRIPLAVAVRMSSQDDLSKQTVVQLKEKLRAAGLPVSGRKAELLDRLSSPAVTVPAAAPQVAMVSFASSDSAYPPIAIEACKS